MNEVILEIPPFPARFLNRRPKMIHSDIELDYFIKSTIADWARTDYTCPDLIVQFVKRTIEPQAMKDYFSQNYTRIPSMKEHIGIIQTINSHIWALFSARPAVTYFDVFKVVKILDRDHRIKIGPLNKMPIVKTYLFYNSEIEFYRPNICLPDVILDCASFLSEKISTANNPFFTLKSVSETEFLHFLYNKYHLSPNSLGLKITNFQVLLEAASVTKIKAFHQLVDSKKATEELRSDINVAVKNVRKKLKTTTGNFFQPTDAPWKQIETFANLKFKDAVKQFFQPFIDEEERIIKQLNLNSANNFEENDTIENVKKMMEFLQSKKLCGQLFQLAAIAGSVEQCKSSLVMNKGFDSWSVLSKLHINDWRRRLFCPLLGDISLFFRLLLSGDTPADANDNLKRTLLQIIERCKALTHVISNSHKNKSLPVIQPHKLHYLMALSKCAQAISNCKSDKDWLTNKELLATLHLDLLPQIHNLLILVLSRSQLDHSQYSSSNINGQQSQKFTPAITLVECVFREKLRGFIQEKSISKCQLSLKDASDLEKKILDCLKLEFWPLEGSFFDFLSSHSSEVKSIIQKVNKEKKEGSQQSSETDSNNSSECCCIGLQLEFVSRHIQQLSPSISLDSFLNSILPSLDGVCVTESARNSIAKLWDNTELRQHHLLHDGLPPALDMRAVHLSQPSEIKHDLSASSPDAAMKAISSVPMLGNALAATKWSLIYRIYWGDICQFVNSHPILASQFNVRLFVSEIGVLRIPVNLDPILKIESAIKSMVNSDSSEYVTNARPIIGNLVAVLLNLSTPTMSLHLCQIIDALSSEFVNSPLLFHRFALTAFDLVPSEKIVELVINVLYPLSKRIFVLQHEIDSYNATIALLKSLTSELDAAVITVLKIYLPMDHPMREVLCEDNRPEIVTNESQQSALFSLLISDQDPINDSHESMENTDYESDLVIDTGSTVVAESSLSDRRAIVEDIRVGEFGIGLDSNSNSTNSRIVESFNNKMARLVDHLSNDLYANTSHFVLELVQNADDNLYGPGVMGSLRLRWDTTRRGQGLVLEVKNNELGFSESDLRSLCDIGASTKCADRASKIGRKGIGFKSVFLVSDRPEIHSNGFHVRFDRFKTNESNQRVSNNALIPTWCEPISGQKLDLNGTTIVLPIIPSLTADVRQSVSAQLKPHLLLFLRNLRKISISSEDDKDERFIELVSPRQSTEKVIVTESGDKYRWSIRSRQIPVIDPELQKISPRGISRTEIAIAIPLNDDLAESTVSDVPAFAFLPIRSYGLRFIVNADFSIPASREDVLHACPWNHWLVEELAQLFSRHLATVAGELAPNDDQRGLERLIECVPLPGEVPGDSLFAGLATRLRSLLSELSWLPDHQGTLHAPPQLVAEAATDDRLARALSDRLRVFLLHPAIASCSRDRVARVLAWLGCRPLCLDLLSRLLAALAPDDLSDSDLVRPLFLSVHTCLERESSLSQTTANRVLVQLSSLPIWPLDNDNRASINQPGAAPVFLPSSSSSVDHSTSDRFLCLRRVVSARFLASFDQPGPQSINPVRAILRRIGVPDLTNSTVIDHAVLPRLAVPPSRQWLVTVAGFLAGQCTPREYRDRVLPLLSFATVSVDATGSIRKESLSNLAELQRIHLPGKSAATTLIHGRIAYLQLDEAYLSIDTVTPGQWREFFLLCGATDCLCLDSELSALLKLANRSVNGDILRYLDNVWNRLSSESRLLALESLSDTAWIPVCHSLEQSSNQQLNQADLPMRRPRDTLYLWAGDPNKAAALVPDSLLPHFPLCPIVFSTESLPQSLGMRASITPDLVAGFLRAWFLDKTLSSPVSVRQSRDFFNWLGLYMSRAALLKLFSNIRSELGGSILLPVSKCAIKTAGKNSDPVELVPEEYCYWTLPISGACPNFIYIQDQQVLEDLNKALRFPSTNASARALVFEFSSDLRDLFVEVIGIREFPSVGEVWPALRASLRCLSSERLRELNAAEIELITDVYNVIKFLQAQKNTNTGLSVSDLPLIPCLSGEYRSFSDQFKLYSWRSLETVHEFQQRLKSLKNQDNNAITKVDFVAIDCFHHKNSNNNRYNNFSNQNTNRWTAAQFLGHFFDLPVLEDELCFVVENRDSFQHSDTFRDTLSHLEVLVSQWFQHHVSREVSARCTDLLASISEWVSRDGNDPVSVAVSLRGHPDISYSISQNVFIAPSTLDCDSYEILLGGSGLLESDGAEILHELMTGIANWVLRDDRFCHLRARFSKFSRSLIDLVDSGDRNQVSIFIRSHNLRVNPFTIDYIYSVLNPSSLESESDPDPEPPFPALPPTSSSPPVSPLAPIQSSSLSSSPAPQQQSIDQSPPPITNDNNQVLKRKLISVSVENLSVVPSPCKKICKSDAETHSPQSQNTTAVDIDTREPEPTPEPTTKSIPTPTSTPTPTQPSAPAIKSELNAVKTKMQEQLASQSHVRLSISSASSPDQMAVISGRIGEQLAFQKLTSTQRLGDWDIIRVDWLNREKESKLPYDFKLFARLRRQDQDSSTTSSTTKPAPLEVIYLEVKATTQTNKVQFDLSAQEVTAAWSFKRHYHLLLVFHSGTYPDQNTKFVHIPDTLGQLQDNQCKLFLDVTPLLESE